MTGHLDNGYDDRQQQTTGRIGPAWASQICFHIIQQEFSALYNYVKV